MSRSITCIERNAFLEMLDGITGVLHDCVEKSNAVFRFCGLRVGSGGFREGIQCSLDVVLLDELFGLIG